MVMDHQDMERHYLQTATLKAKDRTLLVDLSFRGKVQPETVSSAQENRRKSCCGEIVDAVSSPKFTKPQDIQACKRHRTEIAESTRFGIFKQFGKILRKTLPKKQRRKRGKRRRNLKPQRHRQERTCLSHQAIFLLLILQEIALTSVSSIRAGVFCDKIIGLAPLQRAKCRARPDAMTVIAQGAERARYECIWQFRYDRWNCTNNGSATVFGTELSVASRESAFENAIKSAGILYEIVKACGEGHLGASCGCAQRDVSFQRTKRRTQVTPAQVERKVYQRWRWGGCSVDLGFGLNYTREFMRAGELLQSSRTLMNRHNYEAGRLAIIKNLTKSCRCHGVSGSCNVKTCWIALPSFRQVGDNLRRKYKEAKRVEAILGGRRRRPHILKIWRNPKKPSPRELVYLEKSPEFCQKDNRIGVFGTQGRQCNGTNSNYSGCGKLCCNRGYRVTEYTKIDQCKCKFFWCCTVTCQECPRLVSKYTCN
ncbi:protein Wnt-7b isoform X1 [Ciona intestinalis]